MIEWSDEGIVLGRRRHAENAAVVEIFTRHHGRHAGLVHGATSRRRRGTLEAGTEVSARWRARLEAHLGTFTVEPVRAHAAPLFDDPLRLAGLGAALGLIAATLPEREAHPRIYDALVGLLGALARVPDWAVAYARFEFGLLAELGFGLDLSPLAAGRGNAPLYVATETGRATAAPAPGRARMALPALLLSPEGAANASDADLLAALELTGHFLVRRVFEGQPGPEARRRLVAGLRRRYTRSGGGSK